MTGDIDAMIERTAAIVYAGSYTAHMSQEDWERVNERAAEGGGYAAVIVERCYWTARAVVEALLQE